MHITITRTTKQPNLTNTHNKQQQQQQQQQQLLKRQFIYYFDINDSLFKRKQHNTNLIIHTTVA